MTGPGDPSSRHRCVFVAGHHWNRSNRFVRLVLSQVTEIRVRVESPKLGCRHGETCRNPSNVKTSFYEPPSPSRGRFLGRSGLSSSFEETPEGHDLRVETKGQGGRVAVVGVRVRGRSEEDV